MTYRFLIAAAGLWLMSVAAAGDAKPYRVSLVGGGLAGGVWQAGVLVELDPGWKTYWRMPGDSGVAPQFTWTTSVPAEVSVSYPTPARYSDAGGETVGYKSQVLFPVTVKAAAADELTLTLDLFFGVCKDICIPVQAQESIRLTSQTQDPAGSARIEAAQQTSPRPGEAISVGKVVEESGALWLELHLTQPVGDVFVESLTSAYFRAPEFSQDGRVARLLIDNLSDPAKLQGQRLTLTYTIGGKGYEQVLSLN
jgi:DsbC/DsbD-like thiol-disulfide interchange protein